MVVKSGSDTCKSVEKMRVLGASLNGTFSEQGVENLIIESDDKQAIGFVEGLVLANYQFLKYFKDAAKRAHSLKNLNIVSQRDDSQKLNRLRVLWESVYTARDLVNEPVSYLTAPQLGKEIERLSETFGFKAEVFGKAKIQSLKMGGLLSVNKGSIDEPTFSILEWKPSKAINKKPIVLVGKGVVYDTGGLSLKPTPNSMDFMKSDMGGAAAVIGTMCAIAGNELPLHVIGLVPATDNRPGGNAFAPGDVVTVYDGTTVEVMNTDAEGRMLLADALAYAQRYDPELVIDLATLTGAAARAIGKFGIVGMDSDADAEMKALQVSGDETFERVVEFPLWDEYEEELKSSIADVKNLGGAEAGAITAGKFLQRFTKYPYIHLDIAGPAFATAAFNYRGTGGTGVGVRLLYNFLETKASN